MILNYKIIVNVMQIRTRNEIINLIRDCCCLLLRQDELGEL